MSEETDAAVETAFRDEWGRVVAALIRRTGNWDLAEECAQDAFALAHLQWARSGIPSSPGAWLTTVAVHRALDVLRRTKRGSELLEQIGRDPLACDDGVKGIDDRGGEYEDDRLRLIFTCCHPALTMEARVALTLRYLCGLTTAEIARAFLVKEPAIAKRLTRARSKIRAAHIPFRVPPPERMSERLDGVLAVLYLTFNEGYLATFGDTLIRTGLCGEAIRLSRILVGLMPDEPETSSLLALMLFVDSRRAAREGADGELITLEEQDRSLWDRHEIEEAETVLAGAVSLGEGGPYQLQAEIAGCHAVARNSASTDWTRIAHLYRRLYAKAGGPVVMLNRAVAEAMAVSPEDGLAILDELEGNGSLEGYHLLPATRADLLRRLGDRAGAAVSYERALEIVNSESERRYLMRRLAEMRRDSAPLG